MATEVTTFPQSVVVEERSTSGGIQSPRPAGTSNGTRRNAPRPRRPNYAEIHSRPLPLDVFPLPAFIPHNPLSIIRIIYALISQSIWRPSSRSIVCEGYFSEETQSVHITHPASVRALWEAGFFGKGTLSRSEPRWLDQEKRRRGLVALETSEELTRKRREERRQFKLERARKERETIEQQLREEGKLTEIESPEDPELVNPDGSSTLSGAEIPSADAALDATDDEIRRLEQDAGGEEELPTDNLLEDDLEEELLDQEHLQLTCEEAFFLTYALGILSVRNGDKVFTPSYLFRLFSEYSTFPVSRKADTFLKEVYKHHFIHASKSPLDISGITGIQPDNPFVLKYVVYHHFRSLGWVVRPGVKFAVDYLLYNRGPVFAHAEFAVMIIPSYSNPYWSETLERKAESQQKEKRDWWWLHRVNRVQTQVHKTLVLVYVEVPSPWDKDHVQNCASRDIGGVLKRYKVREMILRRWTPNRNRD